MFLGASHGASEARSRRNVPKTWRIDGSLLDTEFERKMERPDQLMG